jgi:hypothetical protein
LPRTGFTLRWHTFSRSYGVSLPSSLTRVLSRALGYSPRPPESVCSTVTTGDPHAAFLGSRGSLRSPAFADLITSRARDHRLSLSSPGDHPTGLDTANHAPREATFLRPRLLQLSPWRCWNVDQLPIIYASRPRLRSRLTLGRIILPQETLGLRRPGFSHGLSLLMPA